MLQPAFRGIVRSIAAVALSVPACASFAGSSTGPVHFFGVHSGDVVMFDSGPRADKPSCSTMGNEWALSLATPTGRAMFAVLIHAQATGRSVYVAGTGQCAAWGDRETPAYVSVVP